MKTIAMTLGLLLLLTPSIPAADTAAELDLKLIAPPDAHLVIHATRNPERDYQVELLKNVWDKVQSEELPERFLKIITSRMSAEDLQNAQVVIDEFKQAFEPVHDLSTLECEESVVAQIFQFPSNQSVVALRLNSDGAERLEKCFHNLAALVEKYSQGKLPVSTYDTGSTTIMFIPLPQQIQIQPACARMGDVVLFSTSQQLLSDTIANLEDPKTASKFDDPRLKLALEHLPPPEDALVFFDAQMLFTKLRGLEGFMRQQPGMDKNPEMLERVTGIFNLVVDELSVVDYEVTVQYTEGHENRTAALGQYPDDAIEKLLGKAVLGGQPFTDWQSWIPADAVAYGLSTGIQFHPAYEQLVSILHDKFPETDEAMQKFGEVQEKIDLRLDADLFQSFSGETVSVTLPKDGGGQESVLALRCSNPDRIRELLHRLVSGLNSIPALATQQISLTETEELAGFDSLNASMLAAFNVKPVIGFKDGWMMIGSSADSIQRVLATRTGDAETIQGSEHFARFNLPVPETVQSLRYTDLHAAIDNAADVIRKIGGIAPVFLGMAAQNAEAGQVQVVSELVALLPSVANVVEEFDFYDASLSTVSAGPLPNSYLKQSVTLLTVPTTTVE